MSTRSRLCLAISLALAGMGASAAELKDSPGRRHEKKLDEVVVTASPLATKAGDTARPTVVLAGAELEDRRAATLGETVSAETGVQSSYFGPGVGRPIIRGQDGARVQVLSSGTGALDASTVSVDHAVSIEPFLASQIEVLKGPATLMYGAGAIGGVVNVVDGRVPDERIEAGVHGRAELGGDTGSDGGAGMVRLDAAFETAALHLDAFKRDGNDIEAPGTEEGVIPNSAIETSGGALGGTSWFAGGNGYIGLALSGYNNLYGIPGGHHHEEENEEEG